MFLVGQAGNSGHCPIRSWSLGWSIRRFPRGITMAKAVSFDKYGSIDVLYIANVEVPHPSPGECVVAVRAAGINPGEAGIRQGHMDAMFPATFPSGEGSDLAGLVSEAGEGVKSSAVGDEVLGWTDRRASHAEHVTVPEDHLVPKPG